MFLSPHFRCWQKQPTNDPITLEELPVKVLTMIFSYIPIRERFRLSAFFPQFRNTIDASITYINFFGESLDLLSDETLRQMLAKYGKQVKGLTFDLFKSTFSEETTQWKWRQSLANLSGLCPNLTELNILICNRHRPRDEDLVSVFESCPKLRKLMVDAQYLNGHCFKHAKNLEHLEMEMCYRITDDAFEAICSRLRDMKVLHVSQLLILSDDLIKKITRRLKNLHTISIVSHPDSQYPKLTWGGLADLGKLRNLRTLCVEGLSAVTDTFLSRITDEFQSPAARNIRAISVAFSYNVSMHGIKKLANLPKLVHLNVDGITKRDISIGLETVARMGRLQKLLLSEKCNVSPSSLLLVVRYSYNLRLLDISNNDDIFNWALANQLMSFWCYSGRRPLTILTDDHLAWNIVTKPDPDPFGRDPVQVVHIHRDRVPSQEILSTTALSEKGPSSLSPSLLAPHIRRGNRYRLIWAPLGPSKDAKLDLLVDQKENFSFLSLGETPPTGAPEWGPVGAASKIPKFSTAAVSAEGDPHSKDWSMDVLTLLLKTHAFEDGASVGDLCVREGILFKQDGTQVHDVCESAHTMDASLRDRYGMAALPTRRFPPIHVPSADSPVPPPACPRSPSPPPSPPPAGLTPPSLPFHSYPNETLLQLRQPCISLCPASANPCVPGVSLCPPSVNPNPPSASLCPPSVNLRPPGIEKSAEFAAWPPPSPPKPRPPLKPYNL